MAAFNAGATAEEIAQQYPSLTLADVYSVIAARVREENERRFDPTGVRDRLLARRSGKPM